MTPPAQPRNIPKCKKWHVNRIEEEMGEIYYYISRNDEHFAVAPSEEMANFIITSCSLPALSPDALNEIYEKFKHLDGCLSDTEWCIAGGLPIYGIAGELWRAIKAHQKQEHP